MTAPKPARPDALLKLSPEEREKVVDEVRFAEYSASLPFRSHQELIQINSTLNKIEGKHEEADYQVRDTLTRTATALELTLLASQGYGIEQTEEFRRLRTRYGIA